MSLIRGNQLNLTTPSVDLQHTGSYSLEGNLTLQGASSVFIIKTPTNKDITISPSDSNGLVIEGNTSNIFLIKNSSSSVELFKIDNTGIIQFAPQSGSNPTSPEIGKFFITSTEAYIALD